jgi:alpha-beta hydrolase superfamily lysophospholipase
MRRFLPYLLWALAAVLSLSPTWAETLELPTAGGDPVPLAVQVSLPAGEPQGVVMMLHGYMASSADLSFSRDWFVAHGWVYVTLDLPGHGGSGGPRHDVDSFATYGDAVALWLKWVEQQGWPGPRLLVAHSLGAAAALEALLRPDTPRPDHVVFCAPLLRPTWFVPLVVADAMVGWTAGLWGSDFAARAHWFIALQAWLKRVHEVKTPLTLSLTVYCGDRDSVVEAGWNRRELTRLVPDLRWVTLPGRDHWFITDSKDREAIHERIQAELGS